jgi:hypothetical protein
LADLILLECGSISEHETFSVGSDHEQRTREHEILSERDNRRAFNQIEMRLIMIYRPSGNNYFSFSPAVINRR